MSTWIKKTTFVFGIACVFLLPLSAQQKPERERIVVPREALEPALEPKMVDKAMTDIRDYIASCKLPGTVDKLDKTAKALSEVELRALLATFRNMAAHPDLEEVTGVQKAWFQRAYNLAHALSSPVREMEAAIAMRNKKQYVEAYPHFVKAFETYEVYLKTKRPKIEKDEMDKIEKDNKARRRREYIAAMRKKAAEEAKNPKPAKEEKRGTQRPGNAAEKSRGES